MRQNVLWLVLDTARRDAFEPYGAKAGASPVAADLARRGAALPSVRSAGCWTVPSHASMFTGLLPRAAGLGDAPGGNPFGCRPVLEAQRDRLLPEVMRRAGYATAGVTTNLWITEKSGFAIGFDEWASVQTHRQDVLGWKSARARAMWAVEGVRARHDDGAEEAGRAVQGWIDAQPRRPFFWFGNLIEAHSPYLPPKPYNDLSTVGRLKAAEDARRYLTLDRIWRACVGGFDVPDRALERMRHLYARAIRSMDDWLGQVLEGLDRQGLLDDTLVIVTSDHGENFGEGGLMGHALSLDERLLHVPFVAAGPGAHEFDGMRSLVELPRRMAAAVGLEDHPWKADELPDGVAVGQFDAIVGEDDPRVDIALEKWGLGEAAAARLTTPLTSATDGRYKLVRRGTRDELFDLEQDPLELDPLAAVGHDGAADRLRDAIEHPAVLAERTREDGAADAPAEEMEQLEAQMRLLGYL